MNKNWLNDILFKVFRSGQPLYFYIGINIILFLLVAVADIIVFLAGQDTALMKNLISEYIAFPADISVLTAHFYTVITYQFFHDNIFHLLFNMLALYWLGIIFSDFLKPRQFHFVYLAGGIAGAVLFSIAYNTFPVFTNQNQISVLLGASASVMAIAAAAATLVPDYTIRLLLLGNVKLRYLVLGLIVLDILLIPASNPGGSFAHLGGALAGYTYIKLLQSGKDLSSWFKKRTKLKVVKNDSFKNKKASSTSNQGEIDAILDKISKSGYEKLTTEEKAKLFKASNHP